MRSALCRLAVVFAAVAVVQGCSDTGVEPANVDQSDDPGIESREVAGVRVREIREHSIIAALCYLRFRSLKTDQRQLANPNPAFRRGTFANFLIAKRPSVVV